MQETINRILDATAPLSRIDQLQAILSFIAFLLQVGGEGPRRALLERFEAGVQAKLLDNLATLAKGIKIPIH